MTYADKLTVQPEPPVPSDGKRTETERTLPCLKCTDIEGTVTWTLHDSTPGGWKCTVCKSMINVERK